MLQITDVRAQLSDKEILTGITLTIKPGETHIIMGPNGSGKSTLAKVIAGHPDYDVTAGSIAFDGQNILELDPERRVHIGLFLAFQQPREIAGVSFRQFLHTIHRSKILAAAGKTLPEARKDRALRKEISPIHFRKTIEEKLPLLELPTEFLERNLNVGFSGGEKKKSEILQLELLRPKLAMLDELDSGLDVDALKTVYRHVRKLQKETNMSLLVITHYSRVLDYLEPDFVHLFQDGKIVESGGRELAGRVDAEGYVKA